MKKVDFTPLTDVEAWLNSDFNVARYRELTEEGHYKNLLEPLYFLNLLYEQQAVVLANRHKPLTLKNHLLGLVLEEKQLCYLLDNLCLAFNPIFNPDAPKDQDRQLRICLDFIMAEAEKLGKKLYPEDYAEEERPDLTIETVKEHLATLPGYKEQIKYLLEVRTEYLQFKDVLYNGIGVPLDEQCDYEIARIEALRAYEESWKNEAVQKETHALPEGHNGKKVPGTDKCAVKRNGSSSARPIFSPESVKTIFEILKSYFSPGQQRRLKRILSAGSDTPEKLVFLASGNRLADSFKQLYNAGIITGCEKKELEQWIARNFSFRSRQKVVDFRPHYLDQIISTNRDSCQNPLINVSREKATGRVVIRRE